jgi:hypothetical protein
MARPRSSAGFSLLVSLVLVMFLAAAPALSAQTLSKTSISFGNIAEQTPSNPQVVTLTNNQSVALAISSISVTGNFTETSKCPIAPLTLAANATCQITLIFTPAALGTETGTLTVNDNGSTNPQTTSLTGVGVVPLNLSPASYNLGKQAVGTVGTTQIVQVINYLTAPVTINSISVSSQFTTTTTTCPLSPNTLAARTICTVSVAFAPTASGPATGTLTVTDSAANSPQTMQLTGTGVTAVNLSPSSLTFALIQMINTASAAQTVTLNNTQTTPLTINSISTTGNFAQTSTCPVSPNTLAAASSCTVSVTFNPNAIGAATGTLSVNTSAGTLVTGLTGTGGLPGLAALTVTPNTVSMYAGTEVQLTTMATFANGSTLNVTDYINWTSSTPAHALVSSTGLVQGLAAGQTMVVANYNKYTGASTVTVKVPTVTSITVTPAKPSSPVGAYEQFSAILHYSNGTTSDSTSALTWSSSSTGVASINASGLAAASSVGTTNIQASLGSITGKATLTVSQPSCTAPPASLTDWWTGDGNVIDLAGNNSATLQNGAAYATGEVAQAFSFAGNGSSILVNSPIYSPNDGTLMFWFLSNGGGTLTGSSVAGQNQAPGFLIDSSGNLDWSFGSLSTQSLGHVNPNQWYQAALTYATSNSESTVNVYLNGVLVDEAVVDANTEWIPQVAFGAYLGGSQPSFAGSMDEIAIFNQALTAQQIQQIYNSYSAGMCKPTLQSITVNPANPNLAPGLSLPFDAVGSYSNTTTHDVTTSATWSASITEVATIKAGGLASAATAGSTTISAVLGSVQGSTTLNVKPSLVSIQVSPQNPLISVGSVQALIATGTFSDGSQQNLTSSVNWTSSLSGVASIAGNGTATGVGSGQSTITATAGSVNGSSVLTVSSATLASIAITPATPSIVTGTNQQFTATGTFSNGSQQNLTSSVTWSSSSSTVATVASNGLATGVGTGPATIKATLGSVNGTSTLTVTNAVLTAIQVTPQSSSVIIGGSQQFSVNAIYSNGTSTNVTTSATWTSSASTVATMSSPTLGLATSTGTGTTTISASYGGLVDSTTLAVQDQLLSIAIVPSSTIVTTGQSEQFSATGAYASGVTQNLTQSVTWSSSTTSVAGVSSSGLASSATPGETTITAALGSVSASANLTVGAANVIGQWNTLTTTMPINPIHTALLPNGEMFIIAGSGNCAPTLAGCPQGAPYGPSNNSGALLVDPFTGQTLTQFSVSWDMFCNGMALLQDGTAFIAGGNLQYNPFLGLSNASIFDPTTNTFTNQPNMAHGRWYPTVLTLSDGTIMTFSGLLETTGTNNTVEFFTEGVGWSTPYTAPFTPDLYPRLHLLPNGNVFYSGASASSRMFNPSTYTWTTNYAVTNYGEVRLYGSSVLLPLTPANNYDPKVMILGGGNPATNTTEIIDLGAATPAWQYGPNMSQARIEMNATLLPSGTVLAVGGSVNNEDLSTASLNADLYNPATNSISSAGANAFPRLYHSVAVLLPDATVWVAGGNPLQNSYEPAMEIYQPAYLFNSNGTLATRPSITAAPASISYGNTFTVTTPEAANISSVVLIRNPTVTHAFGMDQREVLLSFTAGSGSLTVTAPPNGNIAPPGYYMLFLLNSSGVPSVAAFVQMTNGSGSDAVVHQFALTAAQSSSERFSQAPASGQALAASAAMPGHAMSAQSMSAQGMLEPSMNADQPASGNSSDAAESMPDPSDFTGTWTGKFASKHPSSGSFSIAVTIDKDARGNLVGSATLNSRCLKDARLNVSISGTAITLAGSDEAGDNITVSGFLDQTGKKLKATYIADGSSSGRCETDAGSGTLQKK